MLCTLVREYIFDLGNGIFERYTVVNYLTYLMQTIGIGRLFPGQQGRQMLPDPLAPLPDKPMSATLAWQQRSGPGSPRNISTMKCVGKLHQVCKLIMKIYI